MALSLERGADGRQLRALIRMPQKIERFIKLPDLTENGGYRCIVLEKAISLFIGKLFPGYSENKVSLLLWHEATVSLWPF